MPRIEILPHDQGTFLVQSRTHPEDYYIVDFTEQYPTCTCTGHTTRRGKDPNYTCWHIDHLILIFGKIK
jgi:hypothetical protein